MKKISYTKPMVSSLNMNTMPILTGSLVDFPTNPGDKGGNWESQARNGNNKSEELDLI